MYAVLYYVGMVYGFINFKIIIPSKCISRTVLNIFSIHVNNIVYYVFILKNRVAWFTIAKEKRKCKNRYLIAASSIRLNKSFTSNMCMALIH